MPYFFFRELQLITGLLLICVSYMSWSTKLVSLKVCVGFSIFNFVLFLITSMTWFSTSLLKILKKTGVFFAVSKFSFRDHIQVSLLILTLSCWRPLSYRNQSIDLLWKSIGWFLYDNGLRHERVKWI